MKAARIYEFGGYDVFKIEDIRVPEVRPDQVLIKNFASSVNPVDWKQRKGSHKLIFGSPFPIILGYDIAGKIEKCGANVTQFKPGDMVFGNMDKKYGGALAEYVAVEENCISNAPESISVADSAAIPLVGLTALQALRDKGKIKADHKVLVVGAAGGVGHIALQVTKIFNAHVTAISSDRHFNLMNDLKPNEFIDYTKENILKSGRKFDLVFDAAGIYTYLKCRKILNKKGTYITTLPRPKLLAHKLLAFFSNHKVKTLIRKNNATDLKQIKEWIDQKKLKVIISQRFSLEEVGKAHKQSEEYHNEGKILINISS